jgi:hypothetical protein
MVLMTETFDRSPALGFWKFAWEYTEAAKKVVGESELKHVAYYLICHSIELTLKAFLRAKGEEIEDLKKLGHDLEAALREAERLGLGELCPIESSSRLILMLRNIPHEDKGFEYVFLLPELPELTSRRHMEVIFDVAKDLLEKTHAFILKYHDDNK